MSFLQSFKRNYAGVAAVEFALIAPILILLIVGIVDFGRYLNAVLRLENTARAAAEYIVQGGDEANIQTDVITPSNTLTAAEKQGMVLQTNSVCECSQGVSIMCSSSCGSGDFVRRFIEVNISMSYEPIFSYLGLPDNMDINEQVRLQVN